MKGYSKIEDTPLSFDKIMDLAEDDLFQQEEQLRGVLGKISAYAEKTGIREYQIVVYAKLRQVGEPDA